MSCLFLCVNVELHEHFEELLLIFNKDYNDN